MKGKAALGWVTIEARGHAVLETATRFRIYLWMEDRVERARAWNEKILSKNATVKECRAYWHDRGGCPLKWASDAYNEVVPHDMKSEGGRPATRNKPAIKRGRPPKKKWLKR